MHSGAAGTTDVTITPDLVALLREKAHTGPMERRAQSARLLNHAETALTYADRSPEIEAASQTLEAHRSEFDMLYADRAAYLSRAKALFSEETFAPLRFTADEVRSAFDALQLNTHRASGERMIQQLKAALLHLTDKQRRTYLGMSLSLHMLEFVRAERWLDASIIELSGHLTLEMIDEGNVFLSQMFTFGFEACIAQANREQLSLVAKLGLDLEEFKSMSPEQLQNWTDELLADPARRAHLKGLVKPTPEQIAQANSALAAMEEDALELLEREDFAALLLSDEERAGWAAILAKRLQKLKDQPPGCADALPAGESAELDIRELVKSWFPEMSAEIFTPERIGDLILGLKTYRAERLAAGETKVADCASGAIKMLRCEEAPGENRFLISLCIHSMRGVAAPEPGSTV